MFKKQQKNNNKKLTKNDVKEMFLDNLGAYSHEEALSFLRYILIDLLKRGFTDTDLKEICISDLRLSSYFEDENYYTNHGW